MIKVETLVNTTIENAWECWINPEHIKNWYHASVDWYVPFAENDLKVGGKFKFTMSAIDASISFDFEGEYSKIIEYKHIEYQLADGRKVIITFEKQDNSILVSEVFDPEEINPHEYQKQGWQAILNNFKEYVEMHNNGY